jgi:hypothetical protein
MNLASSFIALAPAGCKPKMETRNRSNSYTPNSHDGDSLAPPVPEALARAKPCSDKNINNFTKSAFLLTPRRAEKVRIELLYGMKQVPVCMLMILHLTFAFGTEVGGARESFGKYARAELKEVFDGYAWVLDVLQAPHYHLVGNCGRDVASGFNWRRYERDRWINRELRGAERLRALRQSAAEFGRESTNGAFCSIMSQLVAGAAGCGIGRIALSPVRSLEPLPSYYGRAVARAPSNGGHHVRCFGFAGGWPRCISTEPGFGSFCTLRPGWLRYREHLKAYCFAQGFTAFEEADDFFTRAIGRQWQFKLQRAIWGTQVDVDLLRTEKA